MSEETTVAASATIPAKVKRGRKVGSKNTPREGAEARPAAKSKGTPLVAHVAPTNRAYLQDTARRTGHSMNWLVDKMLEDYRTNDLFASVTPYVPLSVRKAQKLLEEFQAKTAGEASKRRGALQKAASRLRGEQA